LAVVSETLAMDLLQFAQHAKRGTVAVSDVLLAGRCPLTTKLSSLL